MLFKNANKKDIRKIVITYIYTCLHSIISVAHLIHSRLGYMFHLILFLN